MATGTKLVIVESPTKARKIAGYLGDGYVVMASVGHIRDLAQPSQVPASHKDRFGRFGVDVDGGFEPYYIVGADKKRTVADLKSALRQADELYLATDEDREGEAIAWHLVETLKPKVPVRRMVFHEITPEAIKASLGATRNVDADMVDAQETRRVLDRLYGYELSPVLWRKVGPGLSAGRVQSVATRLIVERERERMAFVRAPYWDVTAALQAAGAQGEPVRFEARMVSLGGIRLAGSKDFASDGTLIATAAKEDVCLLDGNRAESVAVSLRGQRFTVASMETKPYRRRPLPPFTTSTLQQAAGNRLSMGSRQTMRAAQGLYENGYITYMRTDSVTLSAEAITAARQAVSQRFGEEYLSDGPKQYATKTAGAQEAHECIRPAGSRFRAPDELAATLPVDQLRLYTLIWQRTLASQMADATGSTATVRLSAPVPDHGEAVFQASGTVIEFPGFMKATGEIRHATIKSGSEQAGGAEGESARHDDRSGQDNASLPPMSTGERIGCEEVVAVGHETQPPARYTEASLVKTLEAKEIGRPSTYASIISTIMDRGYVYERGRALIPSWLAFAVINLLEGSFPTYVDYQFTADMENGLDRIAHGHQTGREWLERFYFGTGEGGAGNADEAHGGLRRQVAELGEIDARRINTIDIGDGLHVRVGRYGPYLEDVGHPDAEGNPKRATLPDTLAPDELTVERGHELIDSNASGSREIGLDPETGGTVEVRSGRFGPYVALVPPETAEGGSGTDGGESGGRSAKRAKAARSARPKMASLFTSMTPETLSLEDALKLLRLPRQVGVVEEVDEETGEVTRSTIEANNGRYGPYLTKTAADGSTDTRSLGSEDDIFTVGVDEAKAMFAQPKYGRGRGRGAAKPPLRELGADPETGKPVTIKDGFYGAYITDGQTNRTLPKQYSPESIDPAEAFRLLAQKREAGPSARRRSSRSTKATKTAKVAKKATATKSAKTTRAAKSSTTTSRAAATRKTATRKAPAARTTAAKDAA